MSYQLAKHTADVRLEVTGSSQEELFKDALLGLMNLVQPDVPTGQEIRQHIELVNKDRTALLVDFLNEALSLSHINKEMYFDVNFEVLSESQVSATLIGVACSQFEEDVKAVTYHEAEIKEDGGQWSVSLVLDI